MTRTLYSTFLALILSNTFAYGQAHYEPKKLEVKGNYVHEATNTIFPTTLDNYERVKITSFNNNITNICAAYENENSKGKTTLSVYLYPAGSASDSRFRDQYLDCLQAITHVDDKEVLVDQKYIFYKKNGYKVNGYQARFAIANETNTVLRLYECGSWFLKTRITSNLLDTLAIDSLNKKAIDAFDPVNLVKHSALARRPGMKVSRKALADSLFLGCIMSSAYKKMEWVEENVDSLEKASGYPDLYLNMYIESLKDFVKFADDHKNYRVSSFTNSYLEQFKSLIANDYLGEFIMEQLMYVAIVPDNKILNLKAFDQWKITHPIHINLNERYYSLTYDPTK